MLPDIKSREDFGQLSFPVAPRVLTKIPGPRSEELLSLQIERESNARSYPRALEIAPGRALGVTIEDIDGNVFIDCLAGAGTLNVGHNNPFVVQAVREFVDSGHIFSSLDLPTEPKQRFIESLFALLPEELQKHGRIQFCGPTGSDAVDAAIKIAKTATGRHEVISFQGAYHGVGQASLSFTGSKAEKEPLGALIGGVHFMPYGYCLRCPLDLDVKDCRLACTKMLRSALEDPLSGITKPAAVIVEAIQGEGGSVVPPNGWLSAIADYARRNDVPLVIDEIQTGFGRTGEWFGFDHEGVVPDILVLSKALGGIGLPLSVVVYHERFDVWKPGAHAGTFRGNQMAMVAGAAAIDFMHTYDVILNASVVGDFLLSNLQAALSSSPSVVDVRGKGLMVGIETTSTEIANAIRTRSLQRGLIVELGGRANSVVRLLPPLILVEHQASTIIDILTTTFLEVDSENVDLIP